MFFVETDDAEKAKKAEAARAARQAEREKNRRPSFDNGESEDDDSSSDEERRSRNTVGSFEHPSNAGAINKGFVSVEN